MNFEFSTKRSVFCNNVRTFFPIIILFYLLFFIKSDLPVHCKREQIEGLWTFRIEKVSFQPTLNDPKTSCGHGFPDKIEKTVGDQNFGFDSYSDTELILESDYKVYDPKNKKKPVGQWTTVYDEAFTVHYQNSVFTAFMKYFVKDSFSSPTDNNNYKSNCDKTMIGWYIPDSNRNNHNWSCFLGFKSKIKFEFSPNKFLQWSGSIAEDEYSNKNNNNNSNFIEMSLLSQSNSASGINLMKYDQEELVKEINSMNLSWKAGIHEDFKGLSFFQLKEKLGLKRKKRNNSFWQKKNNEYDYFNIFDSANQPNLIETPKMEINETETIDNMLSNWESIEPPTYNEKDTKVGRESHTEEKIPLDNNNNHSNDEFMNNQDIDNSNTNKSTEQLNKNPRTEVEDDSNNVTDFSIVSKYLNKELSDIDINKLPKNWDWRNVGGTNYVPSPRLQQNCGSCYIFSLVSSLESRLRIATDNKDRTEFSRQFPLACSFYTEGCQGGYPFLVAKFFNEFELIPESCAPYNPSNVNCRNICDYSKNPIKYYVSRYEYLGGFYGATNEIDLIKEIRARGPIPGNMSVPWTFSYYKNGIFSQSSLTKNSGKFSKTTLFDKNLSWSNVDHSILLVGYGEENGTKYWIGMNTWGTQWGEGGYFRILRGENDCNIETMGDSARISFKNR